MSAFHSFWGPCSVVLAGLVGVWGVLMGRRQPAPRSFYWGVGLAMGGLLVQVVSGVALISDSGVDPGDQHVFYGILIAATFAFAYIYRAQLRRRPALSYGLLLLFAMGLGIRTISTLGVNF